MYSLLELCRWIDSNPHIIRNIFSPRRSILPAMGSTIQETPIYGIVIIHKELSKANTSVAFP